MTRGISQVTTSKFSRGVLIAALLLAVSCGSEARNGGGTVSVQISGEELATSGLPFPEGGEAHVVDGWSIRFDHVLVTVGEVTLSENPDRSPTDQSQTGALVALARGPWAIDLAKEGTVTAEGGEGTAIPLVTLTSMTERDGDAFAADERYAFGYQTLPASDGADKLNLDDDADALYGVMIDRGYSVLYAGTATFDADSCDVSDDEYDFERIPSTVRFELGFAAPTAYVNCQNQANQGDPFDDEVYQRGIAIPSNTGATAQLTFHLEHAFYSALRHDPSLQFDQIAARAVGKPEPVVLLDDLAGVDPTALTDGAGAPLPNRTCDGSALPHGQERSFDTASVPVDPGGDPEYTLRDYRDFITFVTSAQGHLNGGEGLCFVQRKYPAPSL